ncbi:MAG: TonB-dependent receptor [Bacteroidales bacterium]
MKRVKLLLTVISLFAISFAFAQNITVTGTVSDEQGVEIPFASIYLKGNPKVGATTNDAGKYSINVPANGVLVASFIGYANIEVPINGRAVINIKMQSDAMILDDVMIIAYGTADKKSFSGSASTIKGDKIAQRPISNISKALAGTAAGVQVSVGSGQPGSSASIRVRGVGSISASQSPLIVLDGIPYDGSLGSIAASDIESMTVLKDAAANSMYGARGANGVVMINTKRGQNGKTRVEVEIRGGFNDRGVKPYETIRDPKQYLELAWESLNNYGTYGEDNAGFLKGRPAGVAASEELFGNSFGTGGYNPYGNKKINPATGKFDSDAQLMYHDDWLKEPFKKAFRQEYIASMSGGNDKTSFFMSASYLNDKGYTLHSSFERFSARAKVEHQATKWFKLGMNMSYSKSYTDGVKADQSGSGSSYANMFMFSQQISPIYPVYQYNQLTGEPLYDELGNRLYDYGVTMGQRPYGANTNPLAQQIYDIIDSDKDQLTALGFVEIKFLKDFKFTANVSAENYAYFSNSFQTPIGGDALNVGGRNTRASAKNFVLNSQQLLSYNKTIAEKHNIDALLGHETNSKEYNYLSGYKENFLIPNNPELDNAARLLSASSSSNKVTLNSYFARLQYNYDSKYYVTGSYRRDGSSRFHPDVRYGNFWAVGASWRLEQEEFMKDVKWIDSFKVRASYGTQGNDDIGMANAYEDQYSVVPQDGAIGIAYKYRGNPDLTWEKSNNFNVGIDVSLWNRFKFSAEYYSKKTTDLLYAKSLPTSLGEPNWIYENSIDMNNKGVEVELSYDILKGGDFMWNIAGNITYQKNKMLALPADRDKDGKGYRNGSYYYKVGNSIYDYYLFEFAGVDPKTGRSLWYQDVKDKDGNITETKTTDDTSKASYRENGKHGLVDFYGGISTSFAWKGIDLSVQCAYQIGGYGVDSQYQGLMSAMDAPGNGIHIDALNRWTTPGQITDIPKLEYGGKNQNANTTSDRFLTSKSCFSIQNITLGYTLPSSVNKKLGISRLRIYATGDNLWLFSARKGFDPRISFGGGNGYNYSMTKTISLGINLSF